MADKIFTQKDIKITSLRSAELFEIANKYQLFKKSPNRWYLKPLYYVAQYLAIFLAKWDF